LAEGGPGKRGQAHKIPEIPQDSPHGKIKGHIEKELKFSDFSFLFLHCIIRYY
jgi:hypothetical protein